MDMKMICLLAATVITSGLVGCSKPVTYADVKPLLLDKCGACHTDDQEGAVKSGFSVSSYDTVMKGTRLGPVITPGSSESSTLYRMVSGETDPKIHMPHNGSWLGVDQLKLIQRWIDEGARK
jgi:Planctomycete cytochrome C